MNSTQVDISFIMSVIGFMSSFMVSENKRLLFMLGAIWWMLVAILAAMR